MLAGHGYVAAEPYADIELASHERLGIAGDPGRRGAIVGRTDLDGDHVLPGLAERLHHRPCLLPPRDLGADAVNELGKLGDLRRCLVGGRAGLAITAAAPDLAEQ